MTYEENGSRYKDYPLWEVIKQQPYDYGRHGIVKLIVSKPISQTQNPVLKIVLKIYEDSIIYVLKSIDILKNFKNIHWKNR